MFKLKFQIGTISVQLAIIALFKVTSWTTIGIVSTIFVTQVIHVLNQLAMIPDPNPFQPISKQLVKPNVFIDFFKSADRNNRYTVEDHVFQTKDGHNLLVFRMSLNDEEKKQLKDKRFLGKPQMMCPGLASSCIWPFIGKYSAGWYFMDKGYDVWSINYRGTVFNFSHKNADISPEEFFNFTLEDQATIDFPCFIENILRITGKERLTFVTLSLSGIISIIAMAHEKTCEYINRHTERGILLCPLPFNTFTEDPYLIKRYTTIEMCDHVLEKSKEWGIFEAFMGNYNTSPEGYKKLNKYLDEKYGGFDLTQSNFYQWDGVKDRMFWDIILPGIPFMMFPCLKFLNHPGATAQGGGSGGSVRLLESAMRLGVVYNGEIKVPKIFKYDHGKEQNKKIYGSEEVPCYDQENIKTKLDIFAGSKDTICTYEGSQKFAEIVNGNNENQNVNVFNLEGWYHGSFAVPNGGEDLFGILDKIID